MGHVNWKLGGVQAWIYKLALEPMRKNTSINNDFSFGVYRRYIPSECTRVYINLT
jgi:hypothetical protein